MTVKLGDLIAGLNVLHEIYGSNARILSVDHDTMLYTHSKDVREEDFSDTQRDDLLFAGWRWNLADEVWEIQL